MELPGKFRMSLIVMCTAVISLFMAQIAVAHCDTLDGPVIKDAKIAIEKSDVTPVLKWVKKENENEIKDAFKKTLVVRAKGPEAKDLADTYFFETLVRIHRAGERAPYTGLKAAGSEIDPAVAAADKAIEKGNADELSKMINAAVQTGLKQRFSEVMETKKNADKNIDAGRKYVAAYVDFVHYAERLYSDAAKKTVHAHHNEVPTATAEHEHE